MNKTLFNRLKWIQRFVFRAGFGIFILNDYLKFKSKIKHSSNPRFNLSIFDAFPIIFDKTITTPFDRHYIYHVAWATRKVKAIQPSLHVDISSSLSFSSNLSAFIPTEFYDYRPAKLFLDNLECKSADLTRLHFDSNSIESLSCMHTVEHVGLGRYGDAIDPDGDLTAIHELKRVLKPGGNLLFVVPIGKAVIQFNAMRIYSHEQIMSYFKEFELMEFSLIHEFEEDGGITYNASAQLADKERYGCGCFWFKKPLDN